MVSVDGEKMPPAFLRNMVRKLCKIPVLSYIYIVASLEWLTVDIFTRGQWTFALAAKAMKV